MSRTKEINIKSRTYYFADDKINITNFDPNRIKISLLIISSVIFVGILLIKIFAI